MVILSNVSFQFPESFKPISLQGSPSDPRYDALYRTKQQFRNWHTTGKYPFEP